MQAASHDGQLRARPTRPASIAPSISSVLSDATTINAPIHRQRGFKSRESYLAALEEFAESKLYMPAGDRTLHGWYGEETMNDRKRRLGAGREKKKTSSDVRHPDAAVNGRRATIAVAQAVTEGTTDVTNSDQADRGEDVSPSSKRAENQGRLRRFSRAFSGRKETRASSAVVS